MEDSLEVKKTAAVLKLAIRSQINHVLSATGWWVGQPHPRAFYRGVITGGPQMYDFSL